MTCKSETIYIAEDGTSFHTKESCFRYEWDCSFRKSTLLMMAETPDGMKETNMPSRAMYVEIKTKEDVELFKKWCEFYWTTDPRLLHRPAKPGRWIYDEGRMHWVSVDLVIQTLDAVAKAKAK